MILSDMVLINVEPPETFSVRMPVMVTEAQHRRWVAASKKLGVSLGHYIREAVEIAEKASTVHRAASGSRRGGIDP